MRASVHLAIAQTANHWQSAEPSRPAEQYIVSAEEAAAAGKPAGANRVEPSASVWPARERIVLEMKWSRTSATSVRPALEVHRLGGCPAPACRPEP
jgi:hypothetical protein